MPDPAIRLADVTVRFAEKRLAFDCTIPAGAAVVVAGPGPDAYARRAVPHRGVHVQPLRGRVLAGHHHVHVMAAPQAMVHHREQAVGIGRQVDAHDGSLLVHHVVYKARVLVGEAVMILPPNM